MTYLEWMYEQQESTGLDTQEIADFVGCSRVDLEAFHKGSDGEGCTDELSMWHVLKLAALYEVTAVELFARRMAKSYMMEHYYELFLEAADERVQRFEATVDLERVRRKADELREGRG